jgi:hypothetical protein
VDLPLSGKRVRVNADAKRGRVEVEALDGSGKAVAGFGRSDFRALTGDGVRQAAAWKGGERLPAAARSLRVYVRNAELYAVRLGE